MSSPRLDAATMLFAPIIIVALLVVPVTIAEAPEQPEAITAVSQHHEPEPDPLPVIAKPIPEPDITHTEAACNCYNLLTEKHGAVPSMSELISRASSSPGNVAVFMYAATPEFPAGLPHVASVIATTSTSTVLVEEYNYHECKHSTREISIYDHRLLGFVSL